MVHEKWGFIDQRVPKMGVLQLVSGWFSGFYHLAKFQANRVVRGPRNWVEKGKWSAACMQTHDEWIFKNDWITWRWDLNTFHTTQCHTVLHWVLLVAKLAVYFFQTCIHYVQFMSMLLLPMVCIICKLSLQSIGTRI